MQNDIAGGRLTGCKGWMPGVLEEIALAVEMEKPIFLIGGFGGVTRSVCRLIIEKTVPEELTFAWQLDNNFGFKEMTEFADSRGKYYEQEYQRVLALVMNAELRNSLSEEENTHLFETQFVDEVLHLLLKGMSQIQHSSIRSCTAM
jgi:hypothetical protein